MSFALSAGVTGLQAHQKMLDIAGNNLANVNTTAFKSSRITFSELLSETIKKASQPTSGVGGTNPQQMGSGVGVSGISPLMTQGNIINTGNPLDLAMEGEGYFALSDGEQNIYTRAGSFAALPVFAGERRKSSRETPVLLEVPPDRPKAISSAFRHHKASSPFRNRGHGHCSAAAREIRCKPRWKGKAPRPRCR